MSGTTFGTKLNGNFKKGLQERIQQANPRRKLTTEETERLNKLKALADKLERGEYVQNRQLQTWLSVDEYAQIEAERQEQLELREELNDLPAGAGGVGDVMFQVLKYDVFGDGTVCGREIPSAPKAPAPVAALEFGELALHLV